MLSALTIIGKSAPHAARTALFALFRREGKLLNQTVELFPSEILGVLRRRAVHALDALDAAVAELEEKFTAVPVHAVAGAAEKGLVRRLVQHGLARVGTLHLVDAEMAGDDKAHFVFASSMSVSAQSGVT